jgi:WD40 repeat protein
VQTGQELRKLDTRATLAIFSPDGTSFVSANTDHTLQLWEVQIEKRLQKLEGHKAEVTAATISPDGATIVSAGNDQTIRLWDARSGEALLVLESDTDEASGQAEHTGPGQPPKGAEDQKSSINSVALSPDKTIIASVNSESTLQVWDVRSGQKLWALESDADEAGAQAERTGPDSQQSQGSQDQMFSINSVAFSPAGVSDGVMIAGTGKDGTVRLWDARSGQELQVFKGHTAGVTSAEFSPNGAPGGFTLASGGSDGTVRLWEVETGQQLRVFEGHPAVVTSVAFNPDGTMIISAGSEGVVRVWDAQTGQQLQALEGHNARVTSAAFSSDSTTIVSVGNDQAVRVWDAQTGQQLRVLEGQRFAFYSPDGATIISASGHAVQLWTANIEDLLALADSLIQRELHTLTGSERERFGVE